MSASSPTKPTIVFFAGAFADPTCFDRVVPLFQSAGYETVYARVPSLNPSDAATVTCANDSNAARNNVLLPLIEEKHKDVVVFVHSYGGVVGAGAAAGLGKTTRAARNEAGGVIGLIYLVGNIVAEGETLMQAVGGAYPPFIKQGTPGPGLAVIEPAMQVLYGDADPSLASELEAGMIPTALAAFETPALAPAWAEEAFDGRRAYIRTLDDQCNPLFLQEAWIDKSGVKWDTTDLKSSHCPFISRPQEVVDSALQFIEKWV